MPEKAASKLRSLDSIAVAVAAHLKRFENDPTINARPEGRLKPYYNAHAYRAGRYVAVSYISFQGFSNLSRELAERYLKALDEGFVGKHWTVANQEKEAP